MLTVSPVLQNGGIGKQMMTASEKLAKEENCIAVYMQVIKGRDELIAWYEPQGYSDTGERKPFPMSNHTLEFLKKNWSL